jgi:hypothetical protein
VSSSRERADVNVVASKSANGEAVFEVIREIRPNQEIVVFFDVPEPSDDEEEPVVVDDVVDEERPLKKMPDDFLETTPPSGEDASDEMETTAESDLSSHSEQSPLLPALHSSKMVKS